jgi:hypothetical protein
MRALFKATAGLCLALTLWSAVALAVHHHSSANESLKCQICIAANSSTPSALSVQPRPTFAQVSEIATLPQSAAQQVLAFAVSNRPPPAV